MSATTWTVLLISLAGGTALAAATLTLVEIVIANRTAKTPLTDDQKFARTMAQGAILNAFDAARATDTVFDQLLGNWRTRSAVVLVLVSIPLGTAGGIVGAVKK